MSSGEAERHVDLDALLGEGLARFHSFRRRRKFNDDIAMPLGIIASLFEHTFEIWRGDFHADRTVHCVTDLDDPFLKRSSFFCD